MNYFRFKPLFKTKTKRQAHMHIPILQPVENILTDVKQYSYPWFPLDEHV